MRSLFVFVALLIHPFCAAADPGFVLYTDGSVLAPNGLVWHPALKRSDGSLENMNQRQADKCCNFGPRLSGYPQTCPFGAGGAYLPSKEDFDTLGLELGWGTSQGYDPSPIPDLAESWYWAGRGPGTPVNNYLFMSDRGYTGNWDGMQAFAVRCASFSGRISEQK